VTTSSGRPNLEVTLCQKYKGVMLRIPRSERPSIGCEQIGSFANAFAARAAAHDALGQALGVADYQPVGVRCREALLDSTEGPGPWTGDDNAPKKSDFKAWIAHVCSVVLAGEGNRAKRQLSKAQADAAWKFVDWLTHCTLSSSHEAGAAVAATDDATNSLCNNATTLLIGNVPNECPDCGDYRLTPMRAQNPKPPKWSGSVLPAYNVSGPGRPVLITDDPTPLITRSDREDDGECVIPTVPLRK